MRTTEECRLLPQLADVVWQERAAVEQLLYRLTVAKLLLAADERRFVASCLDEVETAARALRAVESDRLTAIEALAADWGEHVNDLTLSHVAETTPEPWAAMFAEHRDALMVMVSAIERTAAENRRLATGALASIRSSLDTLTGPEPQTYTAQGASQPAMASPMAVDRAL